MFRQEPPTLGNQYEDDRTLRSYLKRVFPAEVLRDVEPSLREMGQLAGTELYQMQLDDRLNEPTLTQWDAWGNRVDKIEVTPLWKRAEHIAAEQGVVSTAYEQKHGHFSRVHQCALAYLFTPSTDIYSCPLAMTDGAARTLISSGNQPLIERAVPHLITRDPKEFWTAGQWMTELNGGSDVGLCETVAKKDPDQDDLFYLSGRKWFTSAVASQIALTLARPGGNPSGGRGLALFYIETRDECGRLQHIEINRLKDKLGTRKVPTAELMLNGTPARLVIGTTDGVRNITTLLNITRLWNGISAVALMRRGLALALDYAKKRIAFSAPLSEKPLHMDTLFGLEAEVDAAFHFAFFVAELNGLKEAGEINESDARLLRVLTPIMKLTTGKQSVMVASEVLEAFGGAGYIEDTGLPVLLRDCQVLPIWEGTTNVLALDTLRALGVDRPPRSVGSDPSTSDTANTHFFPHLHSIVISFLAPVRDPGLADASRIVTAALDHAALWLRNAQGRGPTVLEAGARRFAMTLGRAIELALLVRHAQWSQDHEQDGSTTTSARRFSHSGIDLIIDAEM